MMIVVISLNQKRFYVTNTLNNTGLVQTDYVEFAEHQKGNVVANDRCN